MSAAVTTAGAYTIVADQTGAQLYVNPNTAALTFGPVSAPVPNNTFTVYTAASSGATEILIQATTGYVTLQQNAFVWVANSATAASTAQGFSGVWSNADTVSSVDLRSPTTDGNFPTFAVGPLWIAEIGGTQLTFTFTKVASP
ncbi:MAG: hypothetical protein V4550_10120 [Gemmatimonadota bacterium]